MRTFKNQKELFMYIWNSREHKSELTEKPLYPIGHYLWVNQFLHILAKGHYPSYKLREDNIILALPDEHINQEQYPLFMELRGKLRREYYKEIYGKEFD